MGERYYTIAPIEVPSDNTELLTPSPVSLISLPSVSSALLDSSFSGSSLTFLCLYYYFSFAAAPFRDSASSGLIPALTICLQFSTLEMNGKKKTENISKNIEFIFLNQIKI